MEGIEPDIDAVERIGHSEGSAVAKAQVGIPIRVETNREEQGDASTDQDNGQLQEPGREIDAGRRDPISSGKKGRSPCVIVSAQSSAVSDSLTQIDPKE